MHLVLCHRTFCLIKAVLPKMCKKSVFFILLYLLLPYGGTISTIFISISISIYIAPSRLVKSDRLLDHALECKTIIKYLNTFAIDYCSTIFISHLKHNAISNNIHSAPC